MPASLSSLTLSPSTLTGGNSSTGTVTFSGPAPAGGFVVSLSSSSSYATVPTSITVAAGATSGSFAISTQIYTALYTATITATARGTLQATLTVTVGSIPAAPTNLVATSGGSQISLAWNASQGATSYSILRSTTSGSGYEAIASGLASTSYTDTNVTTYVTYYYVIQATNAYGTSPYSNEANTTPFISSDYVYAGYLITFSGGSVSYSGNSTYCSPFAYSGDYNGAYYGGEVDAATGSASAKGPITVTFTWIEQGTPPPAILVREEELVEGIWESEDIPPLYTWPNGSFSVSDEFGDQVYTEPVSMEEGGYDDSTPGFGECGSTLTGGPPTGEQTPIDHYMVFQTPGTSFSF